MFVCIVFTTQMMVEDLIYLTFVNTQNLHFRVSSANIQKYADKSWKCISI